MQNLHDQYLVHRVFASQDQGAFQELYQKYQQAIYAFILTRVSMPEEAEDLTAQVFMKTWEYLTHSQEKIRHFRGFLYKVARNNVLAYYRTKGRIPSLVTLDDPEEELEIPDARPNQFLEQLRAADEEQLIACVQKLKEVYREAVALRYFEELSIPEIAEVLETTPGNTRILIHRGLKALQKIWYESQRISSPE